VEAVVKQEAEEQAEVSMEEAVLDEAPNNNLEVEADAVVKEGSLIPGTYERTQFGRSMRTLRQEWAIAFKDMPNVLENDSSDPRSGYI
jgi:hypothetical protein